MSDPTGFVIDDELAYGPLRDLGWAVDAVPWDAHGAVWTRYEVVVIRSPWDYQARPAAFLESLAHIDGLGVPLHNGLDLVRWNLDKRYLRELERAGVAIVPTVWRDHLAGGDLAPLVEELGVEEFVLKPVVSANADGAFLLDRAAAVRRATEVEAYFAERPLMAQPFVRAVVEEGEYSVFYFNGSHSHTILKTPRRGDFRVQEEHGASIRAVLADDALLDAAAATIAAIGEAPLYLRADFVRGNEDGTYQLMELELVEPALYLRMDEGAPSRFAQALDARARG